MCGITEVVLVVQFQAPLNYTSWLDPLQSSLDMAWRLADYLDLDIGMYSGPLDFSRAHVALFKIPRTDLELIC